MRRLNVTEGLLFVVLWGGSGARVGGGGSRRRGGVGLGGVGGQQWEQWIGREQHVRQTRSVSLQHRTGFLQHHQTGAAQRMG